MSPVRHVLPTASVTVAFSPVKRGVKYEIVDRRVEQECLQVTGRGPVRLCGRQWAAAAQVDRQDPHEHVYGEGPAREVAQGHAEESAAEAAASFSKATDGSWSPGRRGPQGLVADRPGARGAPPRLNPCQEHEIGG